MKTLLSHSAHQVSSALVCGVSLLTFSLSAKENESFTVHNKLVYSVTDRELTLDLFVPKESDLPVPCVMVIQGGGFRAQDGQKFRSFAEYLAEHGFAAALIAYRGSPDHRYMDTVADTKAAVRYVRKISSEYHIDPDRIGAMGRSAGGTLAALLAVTGGIPEFEGKGGHPKYSSGIQAAVSFAGVFDFVSRFTDERHIALQPGVKTKVLSNQEWIGPVFSPDNTEWLRASAINHIDANDPPILFLQCKDDTTVPWRQSQEMHEAMKKAGVETSLVYYKTGGHGFKDQGDVSNKEMLRFFKKHL